MKNNEESGRDWSFFDAVASTPDTPPASGGVRRTTNLFRNSAVAHGESVIVLTSENSYLSLCCGYVGRDESRICFKGKATCTVESHQKNKAKPGPGIFIRSKDLEKVFADPIGDIAFFTRYKDEVLTSEESSANAWAKKFNIWKLAAKDNTKPSDIVDKKTQAKQLQTPGKRSAGPQLSLKQPHQIDPTTLADQGPYDQLSTYERVWRSITAGISGDGKSVAGETETKPSVLPEEFLLRDVLMCSLAAIHDLQQSVLDLAFTQRTDTEYVDEAIETTNLRVSDLEVMVGVAPDDKGLAPNLWTSVAQSFLDNQGLSADVSLARSRVDDIRKKVAEHEDELNKLCAVSSGAFHDIKQNVLTVSKRVDDLELEEHFGTARMRDEDTENALGEMLSRIEDLEELRTKDRMALEELQTSQEGSSSGFPYGTGQHFRSATDIRTYLKDNNLLNIDFGGFLCPYSVLVRVKEHMDGIGSLGDVVKRKKDIKGLKISEPEARVIYSHTSMLPCLFTGDPSDKSEIGTLPKYSKWRHKSTQTGLAYSIEKFLPSVQRKVSLLINQRYGTSRVLGIVAKDMLMKSIDFLNHLVRWVDDTYSLLTAGGNTAEDCWWIVTRVVRTIFEGHLGPARNTPEADKDDVSDTYSSMMIWGSMQCVLAAEEMVEVGLQDHPVVNGAFSTWLVHNTGRREALEAVKLCEKLQTKVKDQEAEISDLKGQLSSLKKTVDNKLSKLKNG